MALVDHDSLRCLYRTLSRGNALACAAAACALAGCQAGGSATGGAAAALQRLKPLAEKCAGRPVTGYVALDVSGSARQATLDADRDQAVDDVASAVAACTGTVRVVAFSKNVTSTVVLGEATFPEAGGTLNSRLIKADKSRAQLVDAVKENLPGALHRIGPRGSDIVGQLDLAAQLQAGHPGASLLVAIGTDGLATAGPAVIADVGTLTSDRATALAARAEVPLLRGSRVTFFGIGKTKSGAISTLTARSLTTFYVAVCRKTGASRCRATTNYTGS